jgi:hypothetical protein
MAWLVNPGQPTIASMHDWVIFLNYMEVVLLIFTILHESSQ